MLNLRELKAEVAETHSIRFPAKKNKDLSSPEERDINSRYRGVHTKTDQQLQIAVDSLVKTISELKENFWVIRFEGDDIEGQLAEEIAHRADQKARLMDKLSVVLSEIDLRQKDLVSRKPIGTTYYIDFTDGSDDNNGLTITTAWKTPGKYTSVTVRSAGDIAYVRANMTHTQNSADIICDEDGATIGGTISFIGCNATQGIDPWSDGSDVRPIIDFDDKDYQWYASAKVWWRLSNIEFRQSADPSGNVQWNYSVGIQFYNCKFNDSGSSGTEGVFVSGGSVTFENCIFVDCWAASLWANGGYVLVKNCSFDGGIVRGSTYGIYALDCAIVEVYDSSFGQTVAFTIKDISAGKAATVYCRNCATNSSYYATSFGRIYLEDEDTVFNTHIVHYWNARTDRVTTPIRDGGASSSLKIAPNAYCNGKFPVRIEDKVLTGTFQVWCPSGDRTITIYMYGDNWGASLPSASECLVEVSYLSNAANANRSIAVSIASLAEDAWTAFPVNFTAARDGWAYVTVILKKYIATALVYVDIKPVAV